MAGTIGGMAVTISIPRRPGEAVAIDTTPTTSAVVVNTTTAAGRAGTASVLARTLGGANVANTLYTYLMPALTVTRISSGTSLAITWTTNLTERRRRQRRGGERHDDHSDAGSIFLLRAA